MADALLVEPDRFVLATAILQQRCELDARVGILGIEFQALAKTAHCFMVAAKGC